METIVIPITDFSLVYLEKIGDNVSLRIDTGIAMKTKYVPNQTLFTIPEGFRPKRVVNFGSITSYDNNPIAYPLSILVDGRVNVYGPIPVSTGTKAYYGIINYSIV